MPSAVKLEASVTVQALSNLMERRVDHTNPLDITHIQFFNYTRPIPP
jgi:hypothetical protein